MQNPQQTTHIPNLAVWLIYHEQMGFISGMQKYLTIQKMLSMQYTTLTK